MYVKIQYCEMTPESRNNGERRNSSLLGNGSINKFPRQRTRDARTEELLEELFSVVPEPGIYSESRSDKQKVPLLLTILTRSLSLYSYQKDERAKPGNLLTIDALSPSIQ
jgi:hypothetical protein